MTPYEAIVDATEKAHRNGHNMLGSARWHMAFCEALRTAGFWIAPWEPTQTMEVNITDYRDMRDAYLAENKDD